MAAQDAPPSPSRRAVVVDEKRTKRGPAVDVVAGVVGVLLLLLAASMVYLLPEVINKAPEPLPQYKVSSVIHQGPDQPSMEMDLQEEGAPVRFEFEVPEDNVVRVSFQAYFEDDVAASKPDTFRVALYDPTGTRVGEPQILTNSAPAEDPGNPVPTFRAGSKTFDFGVNVAQAPRTQFVTALDRAETPEGMRARLAEENHVATAGTWAVEVFLETAGDCPEAEDLAPRQAAACEAETGDPNGADEGNSFVVNAFTYQFFEVVVEDGGDAA